VPILWSHALFNFIAVLSPAGVLEFFELYGSPFGARHAVHNFNRVAEHLCRIMRRLLHAVVVLYFDDFMLFDRKRSANLPCQSSANTSLH
jgi:hypothetical protein